MRIAIVLAVLTMGILPAAASGGLGCNIKDKAVQLSLQSGISRGMGGGFFEFKSKLKSSLPNTPADFRKVTFSEENLTQRWLNGGDLKLLVYKEREGEPHGYVEIRVEAKRGGKEESPYVGTYTLTIYSVPKTEKDNDKPITARGRVTCMAE